MIAAPRFTAADAAAAFDAWGANCGPAALAAALGMTLDEVRPYMVGFEAKGYTNPSLMFDSLRRIGRFWRSIGAGDWPAFGLVRIQWEGPWTAPGVPIRARYRYTHWIAAARSAARGVGIFDVNAMGNGTGWCALADWEREIVPFILEHHVARASGGWHRTHVIEVAPL